jgi:hypothetical protein
MLRVALALLILASVAPARAQTPRSNHERQVDWIFAQSATEEGLEQQRAEQKRLTDRTITIGKFFNACVAGRARDYELYSSPEPVDVVARSAVELCSREESAYKSALYKLATILPELDVEGLADRQHTRTLDLAVTIIVTERQRANAPQERPAAPLLGDANRI